MYKLITLCCTLFVGITACLAQPHTKTATTNKSLLWKITGKGSKDPSYLFGTIHIICPADYVWTPVMKKALKESKKVAFEMDMDDPTLQARMTSGMMLTNGKTLKDFYTEEEYKKLNDFAAKNDLPLQMMQQFNPFALVSFMYLKAVTCSLPTSYEDNIKNIAQEQHKEIVGLETIEEQMKVIETMNEDSVAHYVLHIAEDLDSFKHIVHQMLAVYKKQDLPALYQLFLESPDYKDDLKTLLFDRNKKWVPTIMSLAKAQPTFIAVGVGHLWGDEGVISLLRKEGYTVVPVLK